MAGILKSGCSPSRIRARSPFRRPRIFSAVVCAIDKESPLNIQGHYSTGDLLRNLPEKASCHDLFHGSMVEKRDVFQHEPLRFTKASLRLIVLRDKHEIACLCRLTEQ